MNLMLILPLVYALSEFPSRRGAAVLTRFDHAVVGVRSLDAAMTAWKALGFDTGPGGRHTGRGTFNAIVRFGLDYIELISIYDRSEVESRGEPNALALAHLIDHADGGLLGYAVASDDIEADGRRLREAGFTVDGPTPMQRQRPDGKILRWRLLVPRGGSWGTPLPFIIQWDDSDADRLTWERPGSHANGTERIAALAIAVRDLSAWTEIYSKRLGLTLELRDEIPELAATRARFRVGSTFLDLLAPAGSGIISSAVGKAEQPWQLMLTVSDLSATCDDLTARGAEAVEAPGASGGLLISSESAAGARIVLVEEPG
jgi:hypothetical protein